MTRNKWICEIGCGEKKIMKDAIGIDIRKTKETDIIADARKLPFKSKCFDHVYSSHVIEHFSHREVKDVLNEWIRVLNEGGIFELRCPYLRARALLFALRPSWEDLRNIYGDQDYPENYHKCGFSYKLIKEVVMGLGIIKIKRVVKGYKGIPFIPDSLQILGIKGHSNVDDSELSVKKSQNNEGI